MREMPWSLEAEQGAIGAMLVDGGRVVPFALNVMQLPEDGFFSRGHRLVYSAACELFRAGRPVDVLTVGDKLGDAGMAEVGGAGYLSNLVAELPTASHAEYYLDIVRQKWLLRRQVGFCQEILGLCFEDGKSGDDVLSVSRDRFLAVVGEVVRERKMGDLCAELVVDWEEARRRREAGEEGLSGLPTPWRTLNELTGGMQGLWILAGRPSQGKTTVEDNIFVGLAEQGVPVGRVTLDMSAKRLLARAAVRKAGVSLPKLKAGFGTASNMAAVREALGLIEKYPMFINDRDREVHGICSWARGMKLKHGIQALSVDYVQQVTVSAPGVRMFGENQEITFVSQMFKGLANELGIPIVLLSQLNRNSDTGERVPRMADLRGSGSLEQDASVVVLSYHDKDAPDQDKGGKRPQWLNVAKNQDGETGEIPFWFRANYFRFDETEGFEV
jgi:replicative DNA helicase